MKNLKLELFNFKKSLDYDQSDISQIVEGHMNLPYSEKEIISSLNSKLDKYGFDSKVKSFLEGLNDDVQENSIVYDLKYLYSILDRQNQGMLYRQPMKVLLEVINTDDDSDRMNKILNELSLYNWIPEIKLFVNNLVSSPEKKANLLSGGNGESVYTIVEQVEGGHVALIRDSWFYITEEEITKTLLETHIKDDERLRIMRTLETASQYSNISEKRIDFRVSENLVIGLGVDKNKYFINEDELNEETSLESIFASTIVPIIHKNFYPLIETVSKNIDSFVELDVVKRVTNIVKPTLEMFVFNYKDNMYLYRCDNRFGNSFYKYESATQMVMDVKNEMNFDLTYFFENKLNKETVKLKRLEDKEREISLTLEDINLNINKLENSIRVMGGNDILNEAKVQLERKSEELKKNIASIKEEIYNIKRG